MQNRISINAALKSGEAAGGLLPIEGVALSGEPITQVWSEDPIYIDLAGLKFRDQVPLMADHIHDTEHRVGVITPAVADNKLRISGSIDTTTELGAQLAAAGKNIPWQLSVGATINQAKSIEKGDTCDVNGAAVAGPCLVVTDAELYEVSIVAIGADAKTFLNIQACFSSVTHQPKGANTMADSKTPQATASNEVAVPHEHTIDAAAIQAKAQAAERERVSAVITICARFPELSAKAVKEGWDENKARTEVLAKMEAAYPATAPQVLNPQPAESGVCRQDVLKAALMQSTGVSAANIQASVGQRALEAADQHWHGSIGLQELLLECAAANGNRQDGYRLTKSNWFSTVQAACTPNVQAGVAAVNLSGLLGGVINRRLLDGFGSVDASWKEVADVADTRDFRKFTSYRLVKGGGFQKVANNGELKESKLSEAEFDNKAETYGELLTLTRQDIINDDLGAFQRIPFLLGQDAAMKINEIFWGTFLNNSDFFKSDNKNVKTGCPLSVDNMASALAVFRALRDESGRMLGNTPKLLLIPTELEAIGESIYKETALLATGVGNSAKRDFATNIYTGRFKPVVCPYLSDSSLTGYSATSWYLLGDPKFRAAIQIAFLNGVQQPTVESSEMSFNQLGISYRAYLDWGVSLFDPKAGIKVTA